MEQKQIVLKTTNRRPVVVDLHESPLYGNVWANGLDEYKTVFADQEYSFLFNNLDVESIESLSLFINDEEQEGFFSNGEFTCFNSKERKYYPFRNKFGFAEISLVVLYVDGRQEAFYADYLSILMHRDQDLEFINEMIDYVYNRQDQLLVTGEVGNKTTGDLKRGRYINIETKISLAQEILKAYKDSYGYFSANSRFKTDIVDTVDDATKLQIITPKTLQYITTHPGYLIEGNISSGVRIGNRHYMPQKTLVQKKVYSYDIPENQVIVGFLRTMLDDISTMVSDISWLLQNQKTDSEDNGDYVHSSIFIFRRTKKVLNDSLFLLFSLKKGFESMLDLYRRALRINGEMVKHTPIPSAVFLSVPQYNNIYNYMHTWFDFGIYNLEKERFMMSFINGSVLYEVYALVKILETVSHLEFEQVEQYKYTYRLPNNTKFKNVMCNNTFVFKRPNERLTVYYQPVITNSERAANGINLYRNNSLAYEGYGSGYYTPDYLIKYENGGKENYLILDAKFGNRDFVREKQVSKLVFKYLFSISPRGKQNLVGLYVLYGASRGNDHYESIYDKQLPATTIYPKFDIAPISASTSDERHFEYLTRIIRDVVS